MAQVRKDHNGGLSASTFANRNRELTAIEKEEAEFKAKIKDRKTTLKKRCEDDGIDFEVLKESRKMAKQEAQTVIDHQNKLTSYMRFHRHEAGERMQLIEDDVSVDDLTEQQRNQRWRNEGYRAGIDAANKDTCPHDPNSEAGREWALGWEEGQAKNAEGITAPRAPRGAGKGRGKKGAKANDPTPVEGEAETQTESGEGEVESSGDPDQTSAEDEEAPSAPTTAGRDTSGMTDEDFEANG